MNSPGSTVYHVLRLVEQGRLPRGDAETVLNEQLTLLEQRLAELRRAQKATAAALLRLQLGDYPEED